MCRAGATHGGDEASGREEAQAGCHISVLDSMRRNEIGERAERRLPSRTGTSQGVASTPYTTSSVIVGISLPCLVYDAAKGRLVLSVAATVGRNAWRQALAMELGVETKPVVGRPEPAVAPGYPARCDGGNGGLPRKLRGQGNPGLTSQDDSISA